MKRTALSLGVLAIVLAPLAIAAEVRIFLSSADLRWKLTPVAPATAAPEQPVIRVDSSKRYQEIVGFGGTYSEATAHNLKRLKPETRTRLLRLFFHPEQGAGWSLLRTTINSCDASSAYYDYTPKPDPTLASFSIQPDIDNFMIPGLLEAQQVERAAFQVFASPWTPPVWMKNSGRYNEGYLLPEYYSTWARYISRYLSAYRKAGIPIWGLTPQNEPEAYKQKWEACGWDPKTMKAFLSGHLVPILRRDHPDVKLLIWDHNKNRMLAWTRALMSDPVIAAAAWGIAHHWYEDGEAKMFEPVAQARAEFPNLPLIASEQGIFGVNLMDGAVGELYARDLILNVNHGSSAWVVWGMAFDHRGGPNHAGNFNHSPIMVNTQTGELHINPSYYYLAHFSRFVRPGAHRVALEGVPDGLVATAFRNASGGIVVAVLNATGKDAAFRVQAAEGAAPVALPAHALVTVLF